MCIFYVSGTFPNSNWPGFFQALIFYHENLLECKKSTREAMEVKRDQVARSRLGLEPLIPSIFVSWCSAWPKNTYIKTPPLVFPRGGSGETWNTETEAIPAKIGGGNTTGVDLRGFSNLFDINTIDTTMKRECPPLDYGFVAVACSISLLCFNV
jgi:hypothetical protein